METTQIKAHNDILNIISMQVVTFMVLLDLSMIFGTVGLQNNQIECSYVLGFKVKLALDEGIPM